MKRVLITGASDGIGRALVDVYTAQGCQVFATGRRKWDAVTPPFPEACAYIPADMTTDLTPILDALPDKIDLAILNAGAGKVGALADHRAEDIAAMVALNTTAPLLLAQALYPKLHGGTLAFIGSTAARGKHRDFVVYAATKAALAGAARSLALEWEGKLRLLMLHPGPTATAMHDKAGLGDIAARRFFTPATTVARDLAQSIARGKSRRFGLGYTLRHAILRGRP